MKVALVGNSHLGRIKKEWDVWCRTHRGIHHKYYIHRSMGTHPLRIGTEGIPETFAHINLLGDDVLDPRQYDAVVVMGMSLGIQRVFELAYRYRRSGMPWENGYLLTDSSWDGALDDILNGTDAIRVVRSVKSQDPSAKVIVVPQAHPLEWLNTRSDFRIRWSDWACSRGLGPLYGQLFERALTRLSSALDFEVLTQPVSTIASGAWTKTQFGLAQADDPDNPYWPRNDYFHMNDLFAREFAPLLNANLWQSSVLPASIQAGTDQPVRPARP